MEIQKYIEEHFAERNKLKNNFHRTLNEYLSTLNIHEAIDLYYEVQKYSINDGIEIGLNVIKKSGKYLEETFVENIELEIWYNGNIETIKLLKEYINKTEDEELKILYEKLYDGIKEKCKTIDWDITNINWE
jgi:formyltetrahydrofolate synthetase